MTVFEFLSVAVSIVMALTFGKLIAATPHVFARRARDPVHSGFFMINSFIVLMIWWFVWDLNTKASWTFSEFLIMMGAPASLYLAAHILVSDMPGSIASWKEHFLASIDGISQRSSERLHSQQSAWAGSTMTSCKRR